MMIYIMMKCVMKLIIDVTGQLRAFMPLDIDQSGDLDRCH